MNGEKNSEKIDARASVSSTETQSDVAHDIEMGLPPPSGSTPAKQQDGCSAPESSGLTTQNEDVVEEIGDCRICLSSDSPKNLIRPCGCDGTLTYCHYKCLKQWVRESKSKECEICGQPYKEPYKRKLMDTIARAQKREQSMRGAMLAAQLAGGQQAGEMPQVEPLSKFKIALLLLLAVGLLCVVLFLSNGRYFSVWLFALLRIFSFVLLFYLIGRAVIATQRCLHERAMNRLAQQQQ